MKSARDRWLTTILALCTPCAALARDGEGAVLKTVIAGRVLNGAGQGIAGARVILWRGWRDGKEEVSPDLKELIVAETKTNAEGRYELIVEVPEDKQFDSVQLVFIAQGYGIHEEERISPSDLPPVLRHSDAVLGPDRTVSGRVTDHLGHPVPGILVQVGPNGSPYHPPRRSYGSSILFGRTDADGRFEVRGVNRAGEPRLYLTRPNGRAMYHSWNTRVGDWIDARLPQLGMLEGRVVREATGEPVPGAEIQSEEEIHCRAHQGRYKAEADAEGRFRIEDVLPGEYSIVARASGAYGRAPCVRVHPAQKVACEVRAGPALNVSGVLVYLESGKPVVNLRLLAGGNNWGYGVVMATTGADGRFTLRGLLPARTSIRTYDDDLTSLDLRQGQPPADLRLELMGAGPDTRLIGTIRDADGKPVPQAWVGIPQWALLLGAADDQGRYQLRLHRAPPKPDQPIRVLAFSPNMTSYGTKGVGPGWRSAQEVDIAVDSPLGKASGRVLDADRKPLAGASVAAELSFEHRDHPLCHLRSAAVSRDDGTFTLAPIVPGLKHWVSAAFPGYRDEGETVEPGQPIPDLVLRRADGSLTGRVLDEQGRPLPAAGVEAWPWRPWPSGFSLAQGVTDTEGRFRLDGLAKGKTVYLAACSVDHGPLVLPDVAVGGRPVEIRLPGPVTQSVSGRLLDAAGQVEKDIGLSIRGDHCDADIPFDDLGRFVFTRCRPGSYCIEATTDDRKRRAAVWEVASGAADVEIRFPAGDEAKALTAARKARAERKHPIGVRIPLAENAFLTDEACVGPLPTKQGVWMLRSKAQAGVRVDVPIAGPHQIVVRARRVGKDAVPHLQVSAGKKNAALALADFEWAELQCPIRLERGDQVIGFQLQEGWAADLEWVEVRPE